MRLLHVIPSVNPAGGGPIEGVLQLAHANLQEGHTIEIASLDDPKEPWLSDCPVKVYALGPNVLHSKLLHYGYAPRLVPWLRDHAKNYDAVIINGIWQYHSFGAWRVLHKSHIPYFVFTHGMLDPWFKHAYPLKHLKKWLYWPWTDYRVLRDAKAVLFTCEDERILARQSFWLYRCREVVLGYGTTAPTGDASSQREHFLQTYPALRGKRLFLFLGRIHPKKGCDILIDSFAKVAKHDESLHLVMAGPDQIGWQTKLIGKSQHLGIAHRITWTGMLSGDMKWGAFHSSEVFVLPSHQENFGIVVAEALACSLPVLLSKQVNIWREIEADGAGLVSTDDAAGTADILSRWLHLSQEERQSIVNNTLPCFEKRFQVAGVAKRLADILFQ